MRDVAELRGQPELRHLCLVVGVAWVKLVQREVEVHKLMPSVQLVFHVEHLPREVRRGFLRANRLHKLPDCEIFSGDALILRLGALDRGLVIDIVR